MSIQIRSSQLPVAFKLLSPLLAAFVSLWTAGTLGTLGFGYFAKKNLEKTAYQEIEDIAFLLKQDFQQKQELLHLKARWVSENPEVVKAVESGDRGLLLRKLLPIQPALNLDLMRIVDPKGNVLVSLQQNSLGSVKFQDAAVNRAAQTGLDLSGILLAEDTAVSALISLISIKSSEKILAGLVVGVAIDRLMLEQIRGDTDLHLVVWQGDRVMASTLPVNQNRLGDVVRLGALPTRISIAGEGYWIDKIDLSGFDNARVQVAVLKSTKQTDRAEKQLWLVAISFGVLGGTLLTTVTIAGFRATKTLSDRIHRLTQATQKLAKGDLSSHIPRDGQDELGILAEGFNLMAQQLSDRDRQLSQQMNQLEQTLKELHRTQSQMVQTEKMSALGQMVAGIAHEINNPVNFIDANLIYVNEYVEELLHVINLYQEHYPNPPDSLQDELDDTDLDFITKDLIQIVNSLKIGSKRITNIVLSLRNFSRLDEAELKEVDLHEGIDNTLMILQHRLKETLQRPGIKVVKQYDDLPLVECYAGQLNQVFMNLLANAIDALEENNQGCTFSEIAAKSNTILIQSAKTEADRVQITIADNGAGIPDRVRSRLFDPFFTTKPVGKGTGLGLSISYQVVFERHGGQLWFDSTPGQGTKFIIEIPINQNRPIAS